MKMSSNERHYSADDFLSIGLPTTNMNWAEGKSDNFKIILQPQSCVPESFVTIIRRCIVSLFYSVSLTAYSKNALPRRTQRFLNN